MWHRLLIVVAVIVAMVPGTARADTPYTLGIALIPADGTPVYAPCSSSFVDLTCPGRTLVAKPDSGLDHLGYVGRLAAGTVVALTFSSPRDFPLFSVRLTAGQTGLIEEIVTNLRSFMAPGDTVWIQVPWIDGGVHTNPTAVEYAVMLA